VNTPNRFSLQICLVETVSLPRGLAFGPRLSTALLPELYFVEDARFYQHHGFDLDAMEIAAEHDMEGGRIRVGPPLRSNW
jgi:hypothetical protein